MKQIRLKSGIREVMGCRDCPCTQKYSIDMDFCQLISEQENSVAYPPTPDDGSPRDDCPLEDIEVTEWIEHHIEKVCEPLLKKIKDLEKEVAILHKENLELKLGLIDTACHDCTKKDCIFNPAVKRPKSCPYRMVTEKSCQSCQSCQTCRFEKDHYIICLERDCSPYTLKKWQPKEI